MSGKLFSFENLTKQNSPSRIILDTNFILNFTHKYTQFPNNKNVSDCFDFAKSIIHENSEIFIPQIVINEFCCQVYLNEISEYQHKHGLRGSKINTYTNKPHIIQDGHPKIRSALKDLDIISCKTRIREDGSAIRDKAVDIMQKYNFLPSDAFISAITLINGIKNIATLDVYFAKNIIREGLDVFMPQILIPVTTPNLRRK